MKGNFSVLMSIYIKEKVDFFRLAIDSVFNQTIRPSEVVLVEDGLLTEELELVIEEYTNKYSEIKIVKLPKNVGLGNALNEGLKYCSYELVARMDTDDICKPDRFERQLSVFSEYPEVDVCSSWIDEFIDDIGNVVSQRKLPEFNDEIVKYSKSRCPVNHPTVMYRKSKVEFVGGYQDFPEDSFLWVKLILNKAVFYNIQESLLFFRTSSDMYKRRGGWKYAKSDMKSQIKFYQMGFINVIELIRNLVIRSIVRLMPNSFRTWFYSKCLRK